MDAWLHFGKTDYLLFETWRPSSNGAIAGASIAIFAFGILDRALAALRRSREDHWRTGRTLALLSKPPTRTQLSPTPDHAKVGDAGESVEEVPVSDSSHDVKTASRPTLRSIPPFIPSHDIPRGIIHAIQTAFSYTLMLIVMTFNAAYIISVVLGLGVGEVLFGRVAYGANTHMVH
ncbi:Ctr copper transporter [Pisolithus albus]|nr:Ctr copper transporter [Pisolithus albus]